MIWLNSRFGTITSGLFQKNNILWVPTRLMVCLVLFLMMPGLAAAQKQPLLTRHVRDVLVNGQSQSLGRLPANQSMRVDIVLPLQDRAGLEKFLQGLYDPSSASFRHFLSVPEFTAKFGPKQEDFDALTNFATANGFTVVGGSRDHMGVQLAGPVAAVEAAFHVNMSVYQHPTENRTFYAPDREPTVDLPVQLWHISGLDNYSLPHALLKQKDEVVTGKSKSNATSGSGPSASFLGSDMRAAYYGGTALTGAGQNIGLLEYYGYDIADLNTYYANAGQTLTATVTGISTDGTSLSCIFASGCDDTEQILDMTQALGMAPGINTLYVFVGSTDTAILSAMTTQTPLPLQLSSSWCWTPVDPSTDDPYFLRMAAQGQSFLQAAGDSDAWELNNFVYPSEDPNVISVGGTDLTTSGPGGAWSSETAWAYTGGGISPDQLPIPSWQLLPGVIDASNGGSTQYRNGPDVSANADFTFYVCADQAPCSANLYGGTSFAAPMWAGYVALANQQAAAGGDSPVGFFNPAIYPIGTSSSYSENFHDVTSGSNGYSAVGGYDLSTGWGSPNGASLINALASKSTTPHFTILPSAVSVQQGGNGTATITTAVSGGFDAAVALTATGQPTGVTVSFSPASIAAPGSGTATMTVTLPLAIASGSYPITVSGTGGGVTQTASVSLEVYGARVPTFSPHPATYNTPQSVTLTDSTPGVTIYYTLDGSTPTTASTPYTAPILVSTSTTISALASGGAYGPSLVSSATYLISPPADFVESSFSILTTGLVSGGSVSVSDTTTNQGAGGAVGSLTGFYLSTDGKTLDTLLATRSVNALAAGAASGPVTSTFTLPTNLNGSYYMVACANYGDAVVESNYNNNCLASTAMTITGPDLIESSVSVLTTAPVSGGSVSVSDTATNQGPGVVGTSQTGFYLSTNGTTLGTLLATRVASTLAAGASNGPVTTAITLPTSLSGSYYIVACANYTYANGAVETNYTNNCKASAAMTIAGTDLAESGFSVLTAAPVSGGSVSVSDTVTNQGGGTAGVSTTGFYLSTSSSTTGATLLKTRVATALAAGASNGPVTTSITLPTNLNGSYYLIACANYNNGVVETNYTNNCKAVAMQVAGADLIESSVSVLTTAPVSGGSVSVSDTATNQGLGIAGTSQTGFYLSTTASTAGGTLLKTRTVATLASGAGSGAVTTTITLPTNLSGTYYLIACANYNDANGVVETNYANNCTAAAMQVAGADLVESSVSVLTTAPVSGGSVSVSDTATNQGLGIAGTSVTGFYLSASTNPALGTLLKTRTVGTLAAGASNGPVTTTITLPTGLSGTYYLIVCANYNDANGVVEASYTNNCTAAAMQMAGADLVESSVSVLTTAPVSGGSVSVSDTATNQGLGIAGTSVTGFYLSANTNPALGTLLKTRTVGTLAAGASNGPATTTITLPTNLSGTYYLIACANYNGANGVVESNYTNNCTAVAMQVAGADLVESSVSVLTTAPVSGGSVSVSDTATNQGLGIAGTSVTGFYLSTTSSSTGGTLLKTRTVSTLAAGASSAPVTTAITLPTGLSGTYYMIACANYNDANGVVEANYSNNCTASAPMLIP